MYLMFIIITKKKALKLIRALILIYYDSIRRIKLPCHVQAAKSSRDDRKSRPVQNIELAPDTDKAC